METPTDDEDEAAEFRSNSLRIVTIVNLIVSLTLALFFYCTLILYERYGGDPMKRSINNRIIIQITMSILLNMFSTQPLKAITNLYGPIAPWAAKFVIFSRMIVGFFTLLGTSEIIILRNLMIFKFSHMSQINEDFFSAFLLMWNIGFVIISISVLAYINAIPELEFKYLAGHEIKEPTMMTGYWLTFVAITGTIIAVGSLLRSIKKYIEYKKDQDAVHQISINIENQGYNNQAVNPSIISGMETMTLALICTVCGIFTGCSAFTSGSVGLGLHPITTYNYFHEAIAFFIWAIIPLYFLLFNKNYKRYLSQEFFK